ncbi:MAG TPA: glucosamine-6-phosphate deaminase [Thermomicrobiales bacterium]|jgi:glucosamine-6-phosphate deaminase|nr:glucosamine-6-phosphate deaminase [Thermomicrobiales bacterium]
MTGETGAGGSPGAEESIEIRTVDRLAVRVFDDRRAMGAAAAADAARTIRTVIDERGAVRVAFAAAPSQNEFLAALVASEGLDWNRITAFQLDDYVELPADSPQRFSRFLDDRLFGRVPFGRIHRLAPAGDVAAAEAECRRYAALLAEGPLDVVCLGIGENGHLAFNDPPVADFQDPAAVKVVELDEPCRQQQVNDGCFPSPADVPTHAMTLTIPTLLGGRHLVCVVPGVGKREAVRQTLDGPIVTDCPASALRTHPAATLYLDRASHGG